MKRPRIIKAGAEARFLLDVLAGGAPDPGKVDDDALAALAGEEGLSGFLWERLSRAGRTPPEGLKRRYLAAAAKNTLAREALANLDRALEGTGLSVMVHKGASLAFSVYPDPGQRPMEDVDLLVREEQRPALAEVLEGLGYGAQPRAPHLFFGPAARVDLHTHLLAVERVPARARLVPAGMAPVWEAAAPLEGFINLLTPCPEDGLLFLSLHGLKHSFSRLVWLLDLDLLLEQGGKALCRSAARRAWEMGQPRPLALSGWLVQEVFGRDLSALLEGLPGLRPHEKAILGLRARGESMDRLGEVLLAGCIPGWRGRAAFFRDVAFPAADPGPAGERGARGRLLRLASAGRMAASGAARLLRALAGGKR
ncbi:MAG: nucleotidyltransferase family protein [Deltaproteobacteria bacterium]|nr:nucleotidyltransferase family protein [Deltaproteobacteria bacterium]